MALPPMGRMRSGLRGVMVNSDGQRASISITQSRPMRTLVPETVQPISRKSASASSFRNSIPISSRMRMAPSWMAATPSSVRGSVGRSVLIGMRQGIWSMT
jgi:hypothetical protein